MNFWKNVKKPIIGLSPMDGVTDFPMRSIQYEIGKPDVIYTEFVSAEGFVKNPPAFEKTLCFKENERPIVAQVFGYTPRAFYETILQISKNGFDGIDINMGCPAKSVLQKGGGGALIGDYTLAGKIINESLRSISDSQKSIPLSVKTRIGKNKVISREWMKFLSGFPLAEVTVHGRPLKKGRSGEVDWNEIQKASEILRRKGIICLGNGGVKSLSGAIEKSKKYWLDGILIGQAALGNPWIFGGREPTKDEILDTIIKHAQYVSDFYPPERFVIVLKHFGWYPKNFKNCKQLKIELLKTRGFEEVREVIAKFRQF